MLEAELGRVHAELLGDLVEVDLEGETRLRSAVAALGPAGRLVRERPCPLEPVTGNVIRDGLQRPRVIGARDPVGPVAAAVEQRLEVHAGDGAVPFHSRLHPHKRGVAPAVAVEHLFARDRKSTRLNSSHGYISYAVFCLKKKNNGGVVEARNTK